MLLVVVAEAHLIPEVLAVKLAAVQVALATQMAEMDKDFLVRRAPAVQRQIQVVVVVAARMLVVVLTEMEPAVVQV